MNMKKTRSLYNELGLQIRNKHPKRRVKAKLRHDRQEAGGPNEVTVVDTHSRLCPAADPRFAYRGEDVVQTLERVCTKLGYPTTIRVDNGFIEAFNSKLRAECLNAHWFLGLEDAKVETWRREYNEVRPHGAIGARPPMAMLPWRGTASPADQPPGFLT